MMTIENVHWFLDLFDELRITVWLDGGWGVDALLHEQTRPHRDLDIIIPVASSDKLVGALFERGFTDIQTDDRSERNFVMGHAAHGLIDFHVISLTEDGGAVYGPGEIDWVISPSELGGEGSIGGRPVRCLSAEYQIRSHSGYELHETDFADMDALRRRFGLKLLPEQILESRADDRHA
jgi:lincosamide nucleotidyltransferase A/C/D/E